MESASYSYLQTQKAGPFHIIKVQQQTVELDKEGILNTVSTPRITAALVLREDCPETAQSPGSPNNETHTTQQQ